MDLRAHRFHNPEDVFLVDDETGCEVNVDEGSPEATGTLLEPLDVAAPPSTGSGAKANEPPVRSASSNLIDRLEHAVERARRALAALESADKSLQETRRSSGRRGAARNLDARERHTVFVSLLAVAEETLAAMKGSMPLVAECMHPSTHVVGPDESILSAKALMVEARLPYLPVAERNQPIGIVSRWNIETLATVRPDLEVEKAMVPKPCTVLPEAPVDEAARIMVKCEQDAALVVADATVVGVLTAADALTRVLRASNRGRSATFSGSVP